MPGKKRTTKSVSYTEHDDDDDFVSKDDNSKKSRNAKSNDQETELKSLTRQPPRKRQEKLSKSEQEEIELALKLSHGTVQATEASIEIPLTIDDKESTTSESTVSSYESKAADEYDENSLPKSKRMKREEEEEDDTDEIESNNDEEEVIEEEEEEPTPKRKSVRKSEETKKNADIPTVTSIDLNSSRSITRGQQNASVPTSDLAKKKSNAPLGFPTSKIIIPSVQTSRVGLSRKSSAIKSLHPNLNQRIVHE